MINAVLAQARGGFQAPTTEEFNWPCVGPGFDLGGATVCVNRVALLIILAAIITFGFFWVTLRSPQLVPSKRQALGELAVDFVRNNIIYEVMGREGLRYAPYLTTVFFFIFFGNLLGVIPPFLFSANASLAMPFFLAILTWFIFVITGIRRQGGWTYLRNTVLPPGVPVFVYPLLTPIEFISVFIVRPLSLMIRLGANMIAGHLILVVFLLGTQYMLSTIFQGSFSITNIWAIGAFGMSIVLMAFEVLVAGLQAFIFTILTSVYIASSMEAEH
jgi:F-type H+-transporting ATPase subunit a